MEASLASILDDISSILVKGMAIDWSAASLIHYRLKMLVKHMRRHGTRAHTQECMHAIESAIITVFDRWTTRSIIPEQPRLLFEKRLWFAEFLGSALYKPSTKSTVVNSGNIAHALRQRRAAFVRDREMALRCLILLQRDNECPLPIEVHCLILGKAMVPV